jgi:predicted peptidase
MDTATASEWNQSLNMSALTTPEQLVKFLVDSLVENRVADKKRVYLGGLSMGGFGAYDLVIHFPDYFAAVFAICGQANLKAYTQKAADVPIWIFHGALDDAIDPQPDRNLIKALQSMGAKNARYTEYPEDGHNAWDHAFAEPTLLSWLFSFTK